MSGQMRGQAVVVTSGGLDSTTAVYWALRYFEKEPLLLSFDYGQKHVVELAHAINIADDLGLDHDVMDVSDFGKLVSSALTRSATEVPEGHYANETMKATVVPNRNMVMASMAIGYAISTESHAVVMGMHAGDHPVYPDCRPEFIEGMNAIVQIANQGFLVENFNVLAPFINMTKADIVRLGDELSVPFEDTWSCYKGGMVHCGRCSTCVERIEAFHIAGVDDPTVYVDTEYWKTVVGQ